MKNEIWCSGHILHLIHQDHSGVHFHEIFPTIILLTLTTIFSIKLFSFSSPCESSEMCRCLKRGWGWCLGFVGVEVWSECGAERPNVPKISVIKMSHMFYVTSILWIHSLSYLWFYPSKSHDMKKYVKY